MKNKQNLVDKYIAQIQSDLMKEFGSHDLPLRLRVHIRNLAREERLTTQEILLREIHSCGSLDVLIQSLKTPMKIKLQEKKARRAGSKAISSYGIFGEKIINNSRPIQGGLPGLGKSSRRL